MFVTKHRGIIVDSSYVFGRGGGSGVARDGCVKL